MTSRMSPAKSRSTFGRCTFTASLRRPRVATCTWPTEAVAGGSVAVDARPADLLAADEVFVAGTSCGVIGVVRLDGRDIGTGTEGPVTRRIREEYRALTRPGG